MGCFCFFEFSRNLSPWPYSLGVESGKHPMRITGGKPLVEMSVRDGTKVKKKMEMGEKVSGFHPREG